jgi:ABC-type Mn2+/Zn2+ transport system ATPase subunit
MRKALEKLSNYGFKLLKATVDDLPVFDKITLNYSGDSEPKLVVVYGDNASGKSLLVKLLEQQLQDAEWVIRATSMKNRTSAGVSRAFIYGSDGDQSTGATSVKAAQRCLLALKNEAEPCALSVLDEPDIGLSPRYAKAMGAYIAQQVNALSDGKCVVLVSHSRDLVQSAFDSLGVSCATLGINTSLSLLPWLENQESATIDELLGLEKKGFRQLCAIDRAMGKG